MEAEAAAGPTGVEMQPTRLPSAGRAYMLHSKINLEQERRAKRGKGLTRTLVFLAIAKRNNLLKTFRKCNC